MATDLPKKNRHLQRSRRQEKRGARDYDGSQNSGSGNGWVRKADVRTDSELIEFKTTSKDSFNLRATELRRLWDHALIDGRMPVFDIEFADSGVTCVVLDKDDYMTLRQSII